MPTPTKKTQKKTGTGNTGSTKHTSQTLNEDQFEQRLKEEALKFQAVAKKKPPSSPIRQMTPRVYLAGMAMSGLLARPQGPMRMQEVKREAYQWADFMLSEE